MYDEQYVIIVLIHQADLNLKDRRFFTSQSQQTPNGKITCKCNWNNQSETNRKFEKERHVNKVNEQAETSPNKIAIKFKRQEKLPLRNCQNLPWSSSEEMDREYFHWGRQQKAWKSSEDERKVRKQED